MSPWDDEYGVAGIPSSFRDDPSSTVVWAVETWGRDNGGRSPRRGLDVGCGTARNAVYLAQQGTSTVGFDASEVAIARGRERVRQARCDVELLVHDLGAGLPAGDHEIDMVLDVFVYKHQVQPGARRRYRDELLRVLGPRGRILLSLAEPDDGYYGSCPRATEPGASPNAVTDPAINVDSVLFTLDELADEMSDAFTIESAWRKQQPGFMHGQAYSRRTLATIWRPSSR